MQQQEVKANAYMDKDQVRPAQEATYLKVLATQPKVAQVLAKANPENAHGQSGGLGQADAKVVMAAIRATTPTKSHHWVKGLVAVWCANGNGNGARDVNNARG